MAKAPPSAYCVCCSGPLNRHVAAAVPPGDDLAYYCPQCWDHRDAHKRGVACPNPWRRGDP